MRPARWLALAAAATACDRGSPVQPRPPVIAQATVAANPTNVLSAVVTVRLADADSAGVRFHPAGAAGDSLAPGVASGGDSAVVVPVLGLLPDTTYVLRVVAWGGADSAVGDSLTFRTGTLPADLPAYTAGGPDPLPGYVVFAAGSYGLVIDNTGRVVWYRRFDPGGPGLNFMAQPNGRYVVRPPTSDPALPGPFLEIGPLGEVTRTLGCTGGLQTRFHDLIATPAGDFWVMCDETRVFDLSGVGGSVGARVTGTVVQHLSATGALLFGWNPFDHFAITDLDSLSRIGGSVNWTHGNSLELDADGHLLVSFRSLGEITKIHTGTGAVLWRLGGLRNQFTVEGTAMPPFARQHGVRLAAAGRLVLLDNLGDPTASRAERYVLDEAARTAQLVQAYSPVPAVVTQIGGSTQPLPGERFLVSFGTEGRVHEVDAAGQVLWRIEGNPGYVFRAQRIASLYHPGVGLPR